MHAIEPYYKWRNLYIASEDKLCPFYGREYNEFTFDKKIYNYFIHPQWDSIGSPTIFVKLIYSSYSTQTAIIELIGEWNDLLHNDIMILKTELINTLIHHGIYKFVLLCDNVLNFHGDDDCYYEEWWDDIKEDRGWIVFINTRDHINDEMHRSGIQFYSNFGASFSDIAWQAMQPQPLINNLEAQVNNQIKKLDY